MAVTTSIKQGDSLMLFTHINFILIIVDSSFERMAQQIIEIYEFFLICLELNFSRSCVEIMIEEQCDSVSLKYASATDLEEIGIPSLEAHMIVNSVKAKFFPSQHSQ